jgi:soluble lytic murein transglycosylase
MAALDSLPPGTAAHTTARFDLARGYLLDDYYAEALGELDALTTALQNGAASDDATIQAKIDYLRGTAFSGLGQTEAALAAFLAAEAAMPELTPVTGLLRGRLLLAANDNDGAMAAFRAVADALSGGRDVVAYVLALEALAEAARSGGDYAGAVAAYDEILAVAQNSGYRADIQQRAGQTLAAAGDAEGAIARWRAATEEAPASRYAYDALVELVARDVDFDLYQRAYIDLAAEAWYPAIDAYQAFLAAAAPDDPRRGRALQELGVAYIGAGNYPTAIATLDRTLLEYPTCECLGDAWLAKAQALTLQGDRVGARRAYRTFAREHPDDPQAGEALWRSGLAAYADDNQVEAALDLLALADAFPDNERAPDALYVLGLGALQTGMVDQAASFYQRLAAAYPDFRPQAVGYWLGRALAAGGDRTGADGAWRTVAAAAPESYYGILAAEALQSPTERTNVLFSAMPNIVGPATTLAGDDGSQSVAEQWLAGWAELSTATPAELPEAVANDPDLALVRFLLPVDARGDALTAADRLYERYKDDPQALYALALEFERLGLHRLALISATRLLSLSPATLVEELPLFLQQLIYPRPFSELIESEARANDIDPLLFYSLIRQESQFEEGARSFAAAQGLAQIIPDTGQWVADQLGYPNYSNDLIYRPHINLKFGAYYLDWVRDFLEGDIVGALVGYNAGPGNAQRWREQFGSDDPLYVERLTYAEPRAYIQTILPNYYHYTRLYE